MSVAPPVANDRAAATGEASSGSLESEALALIDQLVNLGFISEADAEFLRGQVEGAKNRFSNSNGFLSSLVELLEFAVQTNSVVNLTRFEIIDESFDAKMDAAEERKDGAMVGFAITVAGAGASMGMGVVGAKYFVGQKSGEDDLSMTSVLTNLSSQISQAAVSWINAMYEHRAVEFDAVNDQLNALLQSDILTGDPSAQVYQVILSS